MNIRIKCYGNLIYICTNLADLSKKIKINIIYKRVIKSNSMLQNQEWNKIIGQAIPTINKLKFIDNCMKCQETAQPLTKICSQVEDFAMQCFDNTRELNGGVTGLPKYQVEEFRI